MGLTANQRQQNIRDRVNELKNKPREITREKKKNEDSRTSETCGKVLRVQI